MQAKKDLPPKKRMSDEEHKDIARAVLHAGDWAGVVGRKVLEVYGNDSPLGKLAECLVAPDRRNTLFMVRVALQNAFYAEGRDPDMTYPYSIKSLTEQRRWEKEYYEKDAARREARAKRMRKDAA